MQGNHQASHQGIRQGDRRGTHVALRPRSRARIAANRVFQVGLVAALVGTLIGTTDNVANATPQRVLQAVDVTLGTDGAITGITSTQVSKGSDDSSATTQSFDPTTSAAGLPVRIQTSYRMGKQAGTDLSDIVGKAGRVVITVTVQNTTVHPARLSYDVAGVRRQQYALIGAPLTVVASADLGAGSLGRVVTRDDSDPGAVTDGVLSQSQSGSSQVQWAAMLAPPRLSPSATFTLVEQTADFQVPSIDLSVQPGLVTDPSVQALVNSAFSDDQGSTLQMESDTVSLIGQVNTVLTSAGAVLSRIQSSLGSSADQLGRHTIDQLHASSTLISTSVVNLTKSLSQLQAQMHGTLDASNQAVLSSLTDRLGQIKKVLGGPSSAQSLSINQTQACAVPVVHGFKGKKATVYDRLNLVDTQLGALQSTSSRCGALIEKAMNASIGTAHCDPSSYVGRAMPATCVLVSARDQVSSEAGAMVQFQQNLLGLYDHQTVDTLGSQIQTVLSSVSSIQGKAGALGDSGQNVADAQSSLSDLKSTLTGLDSSLGQISFADVQKQFATLSGTANAEIKALGTAKDPGSLIGEAATVQSALTPVCTASSALGGQSGLPPILAALLGDVTTVCDPSVLTGLDNLVGGLSDDLNQWVAVKTLADPGPALDGADTAISTAQTQVERLIGQVDDALADIGTLTPLGSQITDIKSSLTGLYDANDQLATCPQVSVQAGEHPLNALARSFQTVSCTASKIDSSVNAQFSKINASLSTSSALVDQSITSTDNARQSAEDSVDRLTTALGDKLSSSGTAIVNSGDQQLQKAGSQLDDYRAGVASQLDRTTGTALGQIASSVSASDRNLEASRRGLTDSLGNVLADLGDRRTNGSGLLGQLVTDAAQTGVSTQRIGSANDQAASFGQVTQQQLGDLNLQQKQLERSLELEQDFPAFGMTLPSGSTHLTVFAFHLGSVA